MLDDLMQFFQKISNVPLTEWPHLATIIKTKQIKAGEYLFRQGEKSEIIAYVSKGLVFTFYTSHNHEQKIKKFSWEGRICSPYSTLLSGDNVCYFSAEALEDTKLYFIQFSDLQNLYTRHTSWQHLGRRLAEMSLVEREKREYETLCLPLVERYEKFLVSHAEIINRIPQYLIASYLGINAVSLSRLRAQRGKIKVSR